MGVVSYETEIQSTLAPSKIFKAVVFDLPKLLHKALPQVIKSVDILKGDGGVGSLRQVNFSQGDATLSVKETIDSIDEEKLTYSYTVIEGDIFLGKIEKIANEIKFEASPDGAGTIIKSKTSYYTIGDNVITEEELQGGKQQAAGLFKALEAYLLANPEA